MGLVGCSMRFKVLVINLADAHARRERLGRHLEALGVEPVCWVDAVRGSEVSPAARAAVAADSRSVRRYGRVLTAGELGCALSHVKAYEQLLAGPEDYGLVLEDDAVLLPEVASLLSCEAMRDWMAVPLPRLLLMTPIRSFLRRGRQPFWKGYERVQVRRAWEGYGYVINRAAAAVMRDVNTPAWLSADDWVAYRKLGGIEVCGMDPFCIGYLETAASQLEADRRQAETAAGRARSLGARLAKLGRQVQDALYYRPFIGLDRQRMPKGWPDHEG